MPKTNYTTIISSAAQKSIQFSPVLILWLLLLPIGSSSAQESNQLPVSPDYNIDTSRIDFGDMPSPNSTTLAHDGARHLIVPEYFLGNGIDAEVDFIGAPDGGDDGILITNIMEKNTVTSISVNASVQQTGTIPLSYLGKLSAWIDFNIDGDFDDSGEQVIADFVLTGPFPQTINFEIPAGAVTGTTFARFRYSTQSSLGPTGFAYNGEVEDYQLSIVSDLDDPSRIVMFREDVPLISFVNSMFSTPPLEAYNSYTADPPVWGKWVLGDWDGDGVESPGTFLNGAFRYTNTIGPDADWTGVWIGPLQGKPVAGRFTATTNHDCIGIVVDDLGLWWTCDLSQVTPVINGQWLGGQLSTWPGEYQFTAGDWNGDGIDTIAIRRGDAISWTNDIPVNEFAGFPNAQYFAPPGVSTYGSFVSGDWDADGIDSFGMVYNDGDFFRRNDLLWNIAVYMYQYIGLPIGTPIVASSWSSGNDTLPSSVASASGIETMTTVATGLVESDSEFVERKGRWIGVPDVEASGELYLISSGTTDDTMTIEFTGTSITVVYFTDPNLGDFTIEIDGVARRTIINRDTSGITTTTINDLSFDRHTLKILPNNGTIAIDAFIAE